MLKRCALAGAALAALLAPADATVLTLTGAGNAPGVASGTITGITIGALNFSSPTDLPQAQFINGWTFTANVHGATWSNSPSDYNCLQAGSGTGPMSQATYTAGGCPNAAGPTLLSLTVNRPGYTSAGALTTVSVTIPVSGYLRQPYPNQATASGATSGSDAQFDGTLADWLYADDTVSSAQVGYGLFTTSLANIATTGVPVTNNFHQALRPADLRGAERAEAAL